MMIKSTKDYYNKLTPSAREELFVISEQVISQIVEKSIDIAQMKQSHLKEISLNDVIAAKENIFKSQAESKFQENKKTRLLNFISISGTTYAIFGLILVLLSDERFNFKENYGLIIILIGVTISFIGMNFGQLILKTISKRKLQSNEPPLSIPDFGLEIISRWEVIERLGKDLMQRAGFKSREYDSVNDLMNFLVQRLSRMKLDRDFMRLLELRNKVLHGLNNPTNSEKIEFIEKASSIINTLENELRYS